MRPSFGWTSQGLPACQSGQGKFAFNCRQIGKKGARFTTKNWAGATGREGTRVYHAGEAMFKALNWPHRPSNQTADVTRVLAVDIAAEGIPF